MYVDSHCHLSFPELVARLPEIRADMAAAGVDRALCICTTLEEFDAVHQLATSYDNFWASAGVHPDNEDVREPSVADLVALAAKPRVVAIGETGLDYYRLNGRSIADMEWQRERFRVHIRAGLATRLPLVIHTRSASDDTLGVLREEGRGESTGVFHCFTGNAEQAEKIAKLNFFLGIGGVATFKKGGLDTVLPEVGLENIVLETDSPYLAPTPHRGKRNEPSYIPLVAQKVAEFKKLSLEEVQHQTTQNALRLFQQNN